MSIEYMNYQVNTQQNLLWHLEIRLIQILVYSKDDIKLGKMEYETVSTKVHFVKKIK